MSRIILLTGKMMISSNNFEDVALAKNSSLHICAKETQGDTRTINFSDPADKSRHDRMVALVTQMLDLNKRLQDAKLEHEKTLLQRQIEATDGAIDKLVYDLYGLTEEEIGIVEGRGK